MVPKAFHTVNFSSTYPSFITQALVKFTVQPTALIPDGCTYHVCINDRIEDYDDVVFNFEHASNACAVKGQASFDRLGAENTLVLTYSEVILTAESWPEIRRHIVTFELLMFNDNGDFLLANINSLYRTFAAMFFQALDLVPERFIKGAAYIGEDFIIG